MKHVLITVMTLIAGLESHAQTENFNIDEASYRQCQKLIYLSAYPQDRELLKKVLNCENLNYLSPEEKIQASKILKNMQNLMLSSSKPMFSTRERQ